MKNPTYYNGVITPFDNASIPLSDRSIFFSDAVYDVMIGRNNIPYQFTEHMARLRDNCSKIELSIPLGDADILETAEELVRLSGTDEFMLYLQVSGHSDRRIHNRTESIGNILITVTEITVPNQPKRVRAIFFPDGRYGYCNLKTTNLLPAVLSMNAAVSAGADVAVFHRDNEITEASYANVFILKKGRLVTPPLSNRILPGITRDNVIATAKESGIECEERYLSKDELLSADAILLSSTTKLLQICTEIDGQVVGGGCEKEIQSIFDALYENFSGSTV